MAKVFGIALLSLFLGCGRGGGLEAQKMKVIETVNRLFIETDNRNWKALSEIFADTVLFDMTSMTGGSPSKISSKDIIAAWEKGLKDLKFIHHQAGNHLVTLKENGADAFCYGIAYHYKPVPSGNNVRIFVGSYDLHLVQKGEQWRIDAFRFNLKFIEGNRNL